MNHPYLRSRKAAFFLLERGNGAAEFFRGFALVVGPALQREQDWLYILQTD